MRNLGTAEDQTWMYEEEESYATGWRQIDGAWYYFDGDGIMQTGWVKDADSQLWYDLDQQTGAWIVRPVMTQKQQRSCWRMPSQRQDTIRMIQTGCLYPLIMWRAPRSVHLSG